MGDTCVEFLLQQSEYTKKMYPWDFACTVRYTLEGATLKKEHAVRNQSDTPMYYEVGGHDAYTLCWKTGEQITDYAVEFEGVQALHPVITDENVMLSREHGDLPLVDGCLPIGRETFRADAMILDDLPVRRASIVCRKNDKRVTMDFSDFPYFALWSPYKDFDVPFVCGARDLGEALRRVAEGATMIRTKGEPGTGDVVQAVRHMRMMQAEIRRIGAMSDDELFDAAKELQVPYDLVQYVHEHKRLPVVNFAAGGVATPADAALMMQLGAEGVFVGSGIFKSGNPAKRAAAIVKAVTNYTDAKLLAELSEDLGEAMVGINEQEIELLMAERGK